MSLVDNWELFEPSVPPSVRRLHEAMGILKHLGFTGKQANEAAAYTLLAMVALDPAKSWSESTAPLRGITPIIGFIEKFYGVKYAPNTRETIRDDAVKFFVEHGLLVRNPDNPDRPTNSGKTVYQVEDNALALLRSYRTSHWQQKLTDYLARVEHIRKELNRHRASRRIPVSLPNGEAVTLSPGGQNPLMKHIIEEFCPRFVPGGVILYVGDTESKFGVFEKPAFAALGIKVPAPAKMPDVVVHDLEKDWLLLIEAVTTAGPIDGKRRVELQRLFSGSRAGLVFVTAFMNRADFRKFLPDISWESEVWLADDPEHMIHFNGERFLGPYPEV
ncbi:MAG TPA: BsuBI/PstI family type II restriction endonuclease [Flavobacteriales bacterium]|nr:BsuBI/PstI family type II restriction endonuclease [Flavobacteriales bacterium]HMR29191.1 BsuBI/PstI family type II restriction endonuclease [Flavobacteriales bacterium]